MKTPEEIKSSVLKECGRLFYDPKIGTNGYKDMGDDPCYRFEHPDGFGVNVYEKLPPEHRQWLIYYRLLNLEAKEIQENSELLTKYKDDLPEIVKYIKVDKLHSEEMVASIQERAKGLVDALEAFMGLSVSASTQTKFNEYVKVAKQGKEALSQWKGGGNG